MKKILSIIIALLVFVAFSGLQTEANELSEKSLSNENVIYFSELSTLQQPRWFVDQPLLANTDKYYEIEDFEPTEKKYRTGTVRDYYINEEKYGLYGVDNTGTEARLTPVESLNVAPTMGANGSAQISLRTVSQFPDPEYIARCNDTMKLKNIHDDICIAGESTTVSYGKLLYRYSTNNTTYGSWNYIDINTMLDSSTVSLTFTGQQYVQFVIIYEIEEEAPNWYQFTKTYYVRGMYVLYISSN